MVAAVGGTLAAVGGFWIAYRQMATDEVTRSPAIHLSCRPEFRLAELAQGIKPPEQTLLLTESGGQWIHVSGTIAAAKSAGEAAAPEPFARCEVRNYGRLPVLNIRISVHLQFLRPDGNGTASASALVDIPGLASDASFEFSLLNGTAEPLRFGFARTLTVMRVDRRQATSAPLFADDRVAELERKPAEGTVAAVAPSSAANIVMRGFKFRPAELHVRAGQTVTFDNQDDEAHAIVADDKSFASGAVDPRSRWRYTFATTGRFAFHCDYHPYMQARIVVE